MESNCCCVFFNFQTLEACVKNCGAIIHEEVASKLLMDDFRQCLKVNYLNYMYYNVYTNQAYCQIVK